MWHEREIRVKEPIVALDQDKVVRLVGVPKSTLNDWERKGVFRPSYVDPNPRTPYRRIYSFRDIVSLRALAQIRRQLGVPLAEIRKAGEYLSRFYESPWSELRFGVIDRRLVFRDPETGSWIGTDGQGVLELNMRGIPREVEQGLPDVMKRDQGTVGQIARHRYVNHNRPTIAGTRILVSTIVDMIESGASEETILREYPSLTAEDIREVTWHMQRRTSA
jgi:uncharacterized protein (DUF433 family)/DNA-binding transcriptional MerR regulator